MKYVMFVVSNMYLHTLYVGLKGKKQILIFKTIENEIFQLGMNQFLVISNTYCSAS